MVVAARSIAQRGIPFTFTRAFVWLVTGGWCAQDQEANKLPAYSKFGQIQIKGKAVSLPIGILFLVGSCIWAIVLFPFVLLAYAFSMAFDKLRRRSGKARTMHSSANMLLSLRVCVATLRRASVSDSCSYHQISAPSGLRRGLVG